MLNFLIDRSLGEKDSCMSFMRSMSALPLLSMRRQTIFSSDMIEIRNGSSSLELNLGSGPI